MAEIIVLSPEDRDLLKEVIRRVRTDRLSTPSRSSSPALRQEHVTAPETFIALPQDPSGIPGLVKGASVDVPGVEKCDFYQIIDNPTSGDPELNSVEAFSRDVYNLSPDPVYQDYFLAVRDKWGRYIAVRPNRQGVGQADGDIAVGAAGVVSLYYWNGAAWTDTAENQTMRNTSGVEIKQGWKVSWFFHAKSEQYLCAPLDCT